MALSNQTDFKLNRNELIDIVLRDLGVYSFNETPTSQEYSDISNILNLMVKSWVAHDIQLWVMKTAMVGLSDNTSMYTVGPARNVSIAKPHKIHEAVLVYNDGSERDLEVVGRKEYWSLSNKSSKGFPTLIYYNPLYAYGELYVWPVIETVNSEIIKFIYQKEFDDLDNSTDDFEFPPFCLNAIRWNLAKELIPQFNVDKDRANTIKENAMESKKLILDFDQENTPFFIQPRLSR